MFRPLSESELKKIYLEDAARDFPSSELKPWEVVLDMYKRGFYEPLGFFEENTLKAYSLQIIPGAGAAVLLDYLAVLPEYRSSGIGSRILEALQDYYSPVSEYIMIECEHPDEAPDRAQALRRLSFYERSGAVLTQTQVRLFGILFLIYRLPCGSSGDIDVPSAMETIYKISVPACQYRDSVHIFPGNYKLPDL